MQPYHKNLTAQQPHEEKNTHTNGCLKNTKTVNGKESPLNGQIIYLTSPNQITPHGNGNVSQIRRAWTTRAKQSITNLLCSAALQLAFNDEKLEKLYQVYASKQKVVHFVSILIFNLCFAGVLIVLSLFRFDNSKIPLLVMIVTSIVISIGALVAYRSSLITGTSLIALSYLLWVLLLIQIFVRIFGTSQPTGHNSGDTTSWLLLLCFFTYVILPARRAVCVVLSVLINISHMAVILIHCNVTANCHSESKIIMKQIFIILLLYGSVNALGFLTAYLSEKNQRKAFLEIKESILANACIEEQLLDQEELLTSVLPRHIASSMMADSIVKCTPADDRFRKMYMTRHENVSILFADVVGFTTLSSIREASEVCSLLNELFTAFDDLAEKYHQLRIKILGDCYYCISGAPEPRSDHAVLCIHMGVGMVEAIRVIRERAGSEIDMRVGIHSGKVMGGVIGQRQWQYDVMSKEVNIANQMESYGIPGEVHVSSKVLEHLDGEFQLEKREKLDGSLISTMDTYLVRAVIKKYPEGTLDANCDIHSLDSLNDDAQIHHRNVNRSSIFEDENHINSTLYKEMIKKEKNISALGETNTCLLVFVDEKLEAIYRQRENRQCGFNILSMDAILFVNLIISLMVYPISLWTVLPYSVAIALITPLRVLSLGNRLVVRFARCVSLRKLLESIRDNRHILTMITTIIAYAAIATVFYVYQYNRTLDGDLIPEDYYTHNHDQNLQFNTSKYNSTCLRNCTMTDIHPEEHMHLEFYLTGVTLTLIATHLISHVGYIIQAFFMLLMSFVCSVFIMWRFITGGSEVIAAHEEDFYNHICAVSSICGAAVVLACLSYQRDRVSRRLFLSRIESDNRREKISNLKELNEKHVHNILPPYIATHFLHNSNRSMSFSESYDNVGVMFIAIPQFENFYSEEHYNNDGLECIRFLNEIISDFDEILNESRFKNVTKIKTIGSTYMVASGMDKKKRNSEESGSSSSTLDETAEYLIDEVKEHTSGSGSTDINQNNESITEVQRNLVILIEFAMALRDQMDSINEQSFNTFMLQIGVNHGPVIGGVIAARKPHFDIWGNTVNVASRMETTGVAGQIQCTRETMELINADNIYEFQSRGHVKVKGKGELETFLLDCSPQAENSYLWT